MSLEKAASKMIEAQALSPSQLFDETSRLLDNYRLVLCRYPQWQQLIQDCLSPVAGKRGWENQARFKNGAFGYTACCYDSLSQQWLEVSRESVGGNFIEQVDLRLRQSETGQWAHQRLAYRKTWKGRTSNIPVFVKNNPRAIKKIEDFLSDLKKSLRQ